jgi:hypothetical protein
MHHWEKDNPLISLWMDCTEELYISETREAKHGITARLLGANYGFSRDHQKFISLSRLED